MGPMASKPMTVVELIDRLKEFPDDWIVVTPGFDETGYDAVQIVETVRIYPLPPARYPEAAGYDSVEWGHGKPAGPPFDAVLINW